MTDLQSFMPLLTSIIAFCAFFAFLGAVIKMFLSPIERDMQGLKSDMQDLKGDFKVVLKYLEKNLSRDKVRDTAR